MATEAAEQADEADEGRSEASGSTMVGKTIVNVRKVVRPSQLIRSVGPTAGPSHNGGGQRRLREGGECPGFHR